MKSRLTTALALLCLLASCASLDTRPRGPGHVGGERVSWELGLPHVNSELERILKRHSTPALAACLVRGDGVTAVGASGLRSVDAVERVMLRDRFHIGSCTKSMTALLAALLVAEGRIDWATTVGEVFPELEERIIRQYADATLLELLVHRSGLPEDRDPPPGVWRRIASLSGPLREQRERAVEIALSQKPVCARGERESYSNLGYTVAGAMLERVAGERWEDLIVERICQPLGMTEYGFGPPGEAARDGAPREPRGHVLREGESGPRAITAGPSGDNPAVIGPAGTFHCSIVDWNLYARLHLRILRGEDALGVANEHFAKLYEAVGDYAPGWYVTHRDWARGVTYVHQGSNRRWNAVIWLAPARDIAIVAASNYGDDEGFAACDEAIAWLLEFESSLAK